jgi:methylisocitrate lyase
VVLTARCEAWLVGHPDAARVARERLVAFADAGADCLYAPGVRDVAEIASLVKAVAPKPVNFLAYSATAHLTLEQVAGLGVRRISVGSALARVAWGAFLRAAREIAERGSFASFLAGARSPDPDGLFTRRG